MSQLRRIGSDREHSARIPSAMRSDFGRVLENLMDVPGSMGAVLVDDDGYAIDYVHDPGRLAEIDVQLLGAQVGQVVARLQRSASKHDLGTAAVVLEGTRANLIAGAVGVDYVLAFLMTRSASVPQGLHHFEAVRSTIEHLLT
jgi:predicted regulator of Ras-like GTPase activity (Roadblock/LC7/MglB family)